MHIRPNEQTKKQKRNKPKRKAADEKQTAVDETNCIKPTKQKTATDVFKRERKCRMLYAASRAIKPSGTIKMHTLEYTRRMVWRWGKRNKIQCQNTKPESNASAKRRRRRREKTALNFHDIMMQCTCIQFVANYMR